jgi:hypothetical protein
MRDPVTTMVPSDAASAVSSAGVVSSWAIAGMALNNASDRAEPRTNRLVFFMM